MIKVNLKQNQSISSDVAFDETELANKKVARWVFTKNNTDGLTDVQYYEHLKSKDLKCFVFQEELAPTTYHRHFQGYLVLKSPQRISWLKSNIDNTCHFLAAKGTDKQCYHYCIKPCSDTSCVSKHCLSAKSMTYPVGYVRPEIYKHGVIKADKEKSDEKPKDRKICILYDKIKSGDLKKTDMFLDRETFGTYAHNINGVNALFDNQSKNKANRIRTDLEVELWIGSSGTGKSQLVYQTYGFDNVAAIDPPEGQTLWFPTDISDKDILVIDEFKGWISRQSLKRLLDNKPMRLPYKGGHGHANFSRIIVISNWHPLSWYKDFEYLDKDAIFRRFDKIKMFTYIDGKSYRDQKKGQWDPSLVTIEDVSLDELFHPKKTWMFLSDFDKIEIEVEIDGPQL